jgi:hypothetical protein
MEGRDSVLKVMNINDNLVLNGSAPAPLTNCDKRETAIRQLVELSTLAAISTKKPDTARTICVLFDDGFLGWFRPQDLRSDDSAATTA